VESGRVWLVPTRGSTSNAGAILAVLAPLSNGPVPGRRRNLPPSFTAGWKRTQNRLPAPRRKFIANFFRPLPRGEQAVAATFQAWSCNGQFDRKRLQHRDLRVSV
jgi:hypothetical protein